MDCEMRGRQPAIDPDGIDHGEDDDQERQGGPQQQAGRFPVVRQPRVPTNLRASIPHAMAMTAATAPGNKIVMPVMEKWAATAARATATVSVRTTEALIVGRDVGVALEMRRRTQPSVLARWRGLRHRLVQRRRYSTLLASWRSSGRRTGHRIGRPFGGFGLVFTFGHPSTSGRSRHSNLMLVGDCRISLVIAG
jgi:hypothetical protein